MLESKETRNKTKIGFWFIVDNIQDTISQEFGLQEETIQNSEKTRNTSWSVIQERTHKGHVLVNLPRHSPN